MGCLTSTSTHSFSNALKSCVGKEAENKNLNDD